MVPAAAHEEAPPPPPPEGTFRYEVVEQIPGTEAAVLAGEIPAIFLRVDAPIQELVLFGRAGEPFARFGRRGVEVNAASPTWAVTEQSRSPLDPAPPERGDVEPRWETESGTPQLTWLETRVVPTTERGDFDWAIPAQLEGEEVVLKGRSVWQPTRDVGRGRTSGSMRRPGFAAWAPGLAAAIGGVAAFAGVAFSRRARARRAGP